MQHPENVNNFIHHVILHPRYLSRYSSSTLSSKNHPKIKGYILKNKPKNKCVCIQTTNYNENED